MTAPTKRPRGRPATPAAERLSATIPPVRVLPEHRVEWEHLGGPEWLRGLLALSCSLRAKRGQGVK